MNKNKKITNKYITDAMKILSIGKTTKNSRRSNYKWKHRRSLTKEK